MVRKIFSYDIDDCIRLPLAILNCLSFNHELARVRVSSNGRGFHILVKGKCTVCEKYADKNHLNFSYDLGQWALFDNKGKKKVSKWFIIKNSGVFAH